MMNDFTDPLSGRYRIVEKLSQGRISTTYKGYDDHLESHVVIKIFQTENLPQKRIKSALKRFSMEAKTAASLTYASIVNISDYGEHQGNPFLVMPYLSGGSLRQFIQDRGQINWHEAVLMLLPISKALAYGHSKNVLHLEINPDQILLTRSGNPMLKYFRENQVLENKDSNVDNPEYFAPDQLAGKSSDARADIYSLGIIFYEMITGRRPYEANSPLEALYKQSVEQLPRPSQFVKDLPERVEQMLMKMLAKEPEDRYGCMEELIKDLERNPTDLITQVHPTPPKPTIELENRIQPTVFGPAPKTTIPEAVQIEKPEVDELIGGNQELHQYLMEAEGISRGALNLMCFIGVFIFGWLISMVFDQLGKKGVGNIYWVPVIALVIISRYSDPIFGIIGILIYITGWVHANLALSHYQSLAQERINFIKRRKNPSVNAILEIGILYRKVLGDKREARLAFREALAIPTGGNADLFQRAGLIFMADKDPKEAIDFFDRALTLCNDQKETELITQYKNTAQKRLLAIKPTK